MTKIKKLLREAHRLDPEAFDQIVSDYIERGYAAIEAPKPGARAGRKGEIEDVNLAMLLADVDNAIEDGMSQNAKLKELAKGTRWSNKTLELRDRWWRNESTIKTHLQDARKLQKKNPEFAEDVAFYRWAFRAVGE